MNTRTLLIIGLLVGVVLVAGCAPRAVTPESIGEDGNPAGFWRGLWHGFIVLVTFVVSLFNDGVGIYEARNKGPLYDLGFVLGLLIFFGGGGGGACKSRK